MNTTCSNCCAIASVMKRLRQVLSRHRPETLGHASRITGITPAAISLLMVHLKKGGFKEFAVAAAAKAEGEVAA